MTSRQFGTRITITEAAPRSPVPVGTTVIGIVGTATLTSGTVLANDAPVVVRSLAQAVTAGFDGGSLYDALEQIFQHISVPVICIATASRTTAPVSLDLMLSVESRVFLKPTLLGAPGMTYLESSGVPTGDADSVVVTKLESIAEKLGAIAIVDSYSSDLTVATTYVTNNAKPRIYPMANYGFFGGVKRPGSSDALGHFARITADRGLRANPSNKPVVGINKVEPVFSHNYRDSNDQAQAIRDAKGGVFVHNGQQFILWGGELNSADPNARLGKIGVRRVMDHLEDRIDLSLNALVDEIGDQGGLDTASDAIQSVITAYELSRLIDGGSIADVQVSGRGVLYSLDLND